MRSLPVFIFWSIFFLLTDSLFALPADTIIINENSRWTDFGNKLVFGIDSSNSLTPEHFRNHPDFFTTRNTGQLINGNNAWATIWLKNESDRSVEVIAEVRGYKDVQVYWRVAGEDSLKLKRTGRYIPFPENELGNFKRRSNKVELTLEARKTYEVFIFILIQDLIKLILV